MTRQEANEILDKVKNGIWQPTTRIKDALWITGDIRPDRTELRKASNESCYVRSRQVYGASAYERIFRDVPESGPRRESED